ncbi:DUF1579 domain-containing protein [Chondromyces apiculatus]|uniref:DUF1579 domain-containing protein n=1 Tax=Chondromyces apiculatus DSM 436 TaxID=1192034 RepID=A0A017T527_9BACT|nr:DUF1579 domain-containing protein [Chondromyces apiculatus]EYF04378.1 Hypothetical protein CAP_4517 [Chondromyces apiculatus DSM 436]
MTKITLEESQAERGAHHRLALMVGDWEGTTKVWFRPDELADESPCHGTIRLALGGRFVIHEYEGTLQGKPISGLYILGAHLDEARYQQAWIDTFHMGTGILFSLGDEGSTSGDFRVLGSYGDGEGHRWGWRTVVTIPGSDQLIITHYNIPPEIGEIKAVETVYHRRPRPQG